MEAFISNTLIMAHTRKNWFLVSALLWLASIHPLTYFNLLQVVNIPQTVAKFSRHSSFFVLLRLVILIQLVTSTLLKNVPFLVPDTYPSLSVLKFDSPSVCQNLALIPGPFLSPWMVGFTFLTCTDEIFPFRAMKFFEFCIRICDYMQDIL